jgi:predicted ATPase with chaperone activity
MIDRFAIVSVFTANHSKEVKCVSADAVLKSVLRATDRRLARNQLQMNSDLTLDELEEYLQAKEEYIELFAHQTKSQRSTLQLMQVARTLADLDGSDKTNREHFTRAEALVVSVRRKLLKSLGS